MSAKKILFTRPATIKVKPPEPEKKPFNTVGDLNVEKWQREKWQRINPLSGRPEPNGPMPGPRFDPTVEARAFAARLGTYARMTIVYKGETLGTIVGVAPGRNPDSANICLKLDDAIRWPNDARPVREKLARIPGIYELGDASWSMAQNHTTIEFSINVNELDKIVRAPAPSTPAPPPPPLTGMKPATLAEINEVIGQGHDMADALAYVTKHMRDAGHASIIGVSDPSTYTYRGADYATIDGIVTPIVACADEEPETE